MTKIPPPGFSKYSHKISIVLKYIHVHLCENLTIPRIAGELYWDEIYIQKRFKQEVGVSLHQYIIRERILLARTLIRESPEGAPSGLKEIAEKVGFPTYSTFYRNYVHITGHSPAEELEKR